MNTAHGYGRPVGFAAAALLLAAGVARAQVSDYYDHAWTGNGATGNWSDPGNWTRNPDGAASGAVPGQFEILNIGPTTTARSVTNQDLASPLNVVALRFDPDLGDFEITGSPIRLSAIVGETTIVDGPSGFRSTARVISAPVELDGAVSVAGSISGAPGMTLRQVGGAGSLTVNSGFLRVLRATYTGSTTVHGELQVGGWVRNFSEFIPGSTEGQGDYLVEGATPSTTARLTGTGTIGLAPGKRITIGRGGHLSPDYFALGPVATTITVNGDVRFGDGSAYDVWGQLGSGDRLTVNGLLDLTGAGDSLNFGGIVVHGGVYNIVVADYQSRLGEFDVVNGQGFDAVFSSIRYPIRVSYTSAAGAGPGQVIVTVTTPEPAAFGLGALAVACGLLARRRSPLPVAGEGEGEG